MNNISSSKQHTWATTTDQTKTTSTEYRYGCRVDNSGDIVTVVLYKHSIDFPCASVSVSKNSKWYSTLNTPSEHCYYDITIEDGVVICVVLAQMIKTSRVDEVSLTADPEYNRARTNYDHTTVTVSSSCKLQCGKTYSFALGYDKNDRLVATRILDSDSNLIFG